MIRTTEKTMVPSHHNCDKNMQIPVIGLQLLFPGSVRYFAFCHVRCNGIYYIHIAVIIMMTMKGNIMIICYRYALTNTHELKSSSAMYSSAIFRVIHGS